MNASPDKFSTYFMDHEAEKVRNKMSEAIRDKLNCSGDYTQNCIEWVNCLTKSDIDCGEKDNYKSATINEAISRLKERFLRLYPEYIKAIYGVGKYQLS